MASNQEVGRYVLPIMPSIEGIGPNIDRQLGRAFGNVSRDASRAIASGVRDGVAEAEAAVKKSSDNIAKLRDKEAAAADKLATAEARIEEVRERGGSALKRAEQQRNAADRARLAALREIESETRSLESAQGRLANAQRDVARGPSNAGGWLDKVKQKAAAATESLQGIGEEAVSGGDGAGMAFLSGFTGQVSKIGGKGGPIAMAITAAAVVALAGGKLIADQVFAGMEQQQARANVQAKLGVDDATMKRIADAAAQSYTQNFGESVEENMDTARAAIESGLLPRNASKDLAAGMIGQLDTVAQVIGEDVTSVSRAASQMLKTGLVPNAEAAFDVIVKGQQAGLNVSQDWLDTISEYSTQFRKLGLDGAEATGLMSQMVKAGARDTDVAADALKEFSIRVVDGSKSTNEAFTSIGLNAEDMQRRFLAGGPVAKQAMQETITAISGLQDPVARNTAMLGLFGTQFEDLGDAGNRLDLSTAVTQLGEVDGAAKRAADTMGGTTASAWESAKRSIETSVDGMQNSLAEAFGPAVSDLATSISDHQPEIIEFFTVIGQAAIAFGEVMGAVVGGALGAVEGLAKLTANILDFIPGMDDSAESVRNFGRDLGDAKDTVYEMTSDLDEARQKLGETGKETAAATRFVKDLNGAAVKLSADNYHVEITDNTPEALAKIDQTKYEILHLPDGTIQIFPKTEEATNDLEAWRSQQEKSPINIPVDPQLDPNAAKGWLNQFKAVIAPPGTAPMPGQITGGRDGAGSMILPVPPRAAGGIDGIGQEAHIGGPVYPDGLVRYREPSTGGEAYIPLNASQRSIDIWQETGRRLGVWAFAQGGMLGDAGGLLPFTQQLRALTFQTFPMVSSIGGYRSPDGYNEHSSGRALDVMVPGWQSPAGIALGNQIAQWALSIPGVNRVMWQQSIIRPGGQVEPIPDRGSPTANHMDHVHIFTDDVGAGQVPTASLAGFNSSLGSTPGFGGAGFSGTPGINPETGESGYYVPDAKSVKNAQDKVADADARVALAEQRQRELEADAKESQKLSAQDEVNKARREAADARADLADAQRGKFTTGPKGSKGDAGGKDDLSGIGGIFGSFLKETFGLDGSLFPDISNLMPVKMLGAAMTAFKGPIQGAIDGGLGIQQPGWTPGAPVQMPQAASGLPFGMVPSPFDLAGGQQQPGAAPTGTPASGIGAGPLPGPVDNSRHVAVTVNGVDENKVADNVRRQIFNADRVMTYAPKGNG